MEKRKWIGWGLLPLLLAACQPQQSPVKQDVVLDVSWVKEDCPYRDSVNAWISIDTRWHFAKKDSACFADSASLARYFHEQADEELNLYLEEMKDVDIQEDDAIYYTDHLVIFKENETPEEVTYSCSEYQCEGQTHPWISLKMAVFDKRTGRKLSEDHYGDYVEK